MVSPSHPPAIPSAITTRYDVRLDTIRAHRYAWSLLRVRDTNILVDAIDPGAFAADERLPYWAQLWSSSVVLARHLRSMKDLHGARVLELGCGLGLAGIAAAQSGASVMMTDYEDDALMFARFNVELNLEKEERARVTFHHLDWRGEDAPGMFDLVLGADIIYERGNFPSIRNLLRRTLVRGGKALLADPDRTIGRDFLVSAEREGMAVARRPVKLTHRGTRSTIVLSEVTMPAVAGVEP